MFWMFNDCWPTANWSVIDYYRKPKPAYYAARRACAPWLPIIMERQGRIEFYLSNETSKPAQVVFCYGNSSLTGRERGVQTHSLRLAANTVVRVAAILKKQNELKCGGYWFARVQVNRRHLPEVTYFPDGWKDIKWPQPNVSIQRRSVRRAGQTQITRLTISSDAYTRLCHLSYSEDAGQVWFTDNYFDLPAGGVHTLEAHTTHVLNVKKISIGHWLTEWK